MDIVKVKKKEQTVIEPNPVLYKQLEKRITDVLQIYDFYGSNNVQCESAGYVLRMLGCVPLQNDLKEFISLTENPTEKGKIRFADFIKTLFAWLLEERMKPAQANEILDALRSIDAGDGITAKRFSSLISEYGESINDDQLKKMLVVGTDTRTGKCHCDTYAFQLLYNPKDSIYDLAKEIMKPVEMPDGPETIAQKPTKKKNEPAGA